LKAISSFLGSIDEEAAVFRYKDIMGNILDVVIEVLKVDEDQGQQSLQSLVELSEAHGEIWQQHLSKLIYVAAEVMKNEHF